VDDSFHVDREPSLVVEMMGKYYIMLFVLENAASIALSFFILLGIFVFVVFTYYVHVKNAVGGAGND